jgi:phosphatidylglycerophosphate synthase
VVTPWLAGAFVLATLRDFLVAGMREAIGERKTALKATTLAKWKTAAQMIALSALLLAPLLGDGARATVWHLGLGLLALATLLTATTGIGYVAAAFRILKEDAAGTASQTDEARP